MGTLSGKVALVTGSSRGIGKGIALCLGEAGATVYITGRTEDKSQATVPLDGTIHQTAEEVTKRGGKGIAIRCDHYDDAQVEAVFKQIQADQGRLDILVNNAWVGYEGWHNNTFLPPMHPFWERGTSFWDVNLAGVRWAYIATTFAAPMMVEQKSGLIINVSFGALGHDNVAYNIAKTATDRMTADVAEVVKADNVAVICLHPGLVRTEGVMLNAQYFDMSNSESPEYIGRAAVALATDFNRMSKTGQALVVARLANEYDFDDIDGKRPTAIE